MKPDVTRVLVVDDNERARDRLIEQLRFEDVEVVGESILGAAAYTWAEQLEVDVVLAAVEEPVARALRTVESLAVGARAWPVVGISSLGDRETMRKAMVAGCRDFLVAPVSPEELRTAIVNVRRVERSRRAAREGGEAASRLGTIVTVFGVKGGIGKSTLAANVAVALAEQTRQHVAMLDLDLQFGDAAVMLDLLPSHTVEHLAREIDRLDPQLVLGYLAEHPSRVKLLAAPATPEGSEAVGDEQVGRILEALASTSDYVVVDTASQLDAVSMTALDLSTLVLLVATPEVPCIRRTKACLTLMQEWGYSRDKVKLVVNRTHRKSQVKLAEIEEVLQYPVFAAIPDDRTVGKAVALGTPVAMSAPKSSSGWAINELGRRLAGLPERRRRFSFDRSAKTRPMDRPDAVQVPVPVAPVGPVPAPAANGGEGIGEAVVAAWGASAPSAADGNGAPGRTRFAAWPASAAPAAPTGAATAPGLVASRAHRSAFGREVEPGAAASLASPDLPLAANGTDSGD
jgi:pilus assembly protein CpaE